MRARTVPALLIAATVLAVAPAAASAHAMVESTSPAGGARLKEAPGAVMVRFNEPVEAAFGAVRVYDGHGRPVGASSVTRPHGRGDELAVRLRPGLGDGGYTVTYRVISADSHPVSGGFVFNVGSGSMAAHSVDELLRGADAGPMTSTTLGAARAVQFAAIALGLGAGLFLVVVWLPALRETAGSEASWSAASAAFSSRLRAIVLVAATAGALSGAAAITLQGAVATGDSLWGALDPAVIKDVLGTRFGTVWALGLLAWVWIDAVAGLRPPAPSLRPASVGATGLALPGRTVPPAAAALLVPLAALAFLPSLGGHAGVESPQIVLLPANVLHVVAVSAWIGGLATIVLAVRAASARLQEPERTRLLAASVGRFSMLAGVAVTVVLASGVAQSIVYLGDLQDLIDTSFGRAVAIKIVLFVALLALGWVNRSHLLPHIRAAAAGRLASGRAGSLLRRTLRAELALGAAALAVTGALAGYAPPTAVSTGPVSREADLGPAHLEATVDPARVGSNAIHLHLSSRRTGASFEASRELTVEASLPDKGIARIVLHAHKLAPGRYVIRHASLGLAGDWMLAVTSRVSDFDEYTSHITVPIR